MPERMPKLILFLLLISSTILAQGKLNTCPSVIDSISRQPIFTIGEQMPQPRDGQSKLISRILKEFKFPKGDYRYGGKVHLKFAVQPSGTLSNLLIVKDPSGAKGLFGKQIFNIAKKQKWNPGRCSGKAVAMYYDLLFSCVMPETD